MHLSKPTERTIQTVNSNAHCGFEVTTCECRLSQSVPLWCGMVTVGEAVQKWGQGHMGTLLLSALFFCAPKTALKNRFHLKKSSPSNTFNGSSPYLLHTHTPNSLAWHQAPTIGCQLLPSEERRAPCFPLYVSRTSHVPRKTLCLNYPFLCFHFRVLQGPLKPHALPHSKLRFPPLNADSQPHLCGTTFYLVFCAHSSHKLIDG